MTLSILIPTLPERWQKLYEFLNTVEYDPSVVEILIDCRDNHTPTGTKRNDLMDSARGKYIVSRDDDDFTTEDYIPEILKAAEKDPDVITFEGKMTTNGANEIDWIIKLGEQYEERIDHGVRKYFRFPNHLCPMKRELVKDVRFPDEWIGEDYKWAKEIKDRGLLKSEVHIDKQLYHYQFSTLKHKK